MSGHKPWSEIKHKSNLVQTFLDKERALTAKLNTAKWQTNKFQLENEQLKQEVERLNRENQELKLDLRSQLHMDAGS